MITRPGKKEFAAFTRAIVSNEFDLDDRYPSLQRLGIVKHPIVLAARNTYLFDKEKIWSQIPLAGTLLIPSSAYDKDHMLNGCGFDVNDIPNLINLAKETGRVRFGLADPPQYFGKWIILNQYLENSSHLNYYFTCHMRL